MNQRLTNRQTGLGEGREGTDFALFEDQIDEAAALVVFDESMVLRRLVEIRPVYIRHHTLCKQPYR